MLRCAITDGTASSFVNTVQIRRLKEQVRRWIKDGIDLIQLREKDLEPGALLALAEAAAHELREARSPTKLLINTRAEVALAARADGVHLTAHPAELTPAQVRTLYARAGVPSPIVSVSCHTADEVRQARDRGADLILFGPVFEKRARSQLVARGTGLEALAQACTLANPVPVLALGGVTTQNAAECIAAGAAGVAGIRTFV